MEFDKLAKGFMLELSISIQILVQFNARICYAKSL